MRVRRREMARTWWVAALMAGCLLALGGCRGALPDSALQRFLDRYQALPAAQQEAALRPLAAAGGPEAPFAHYALGNLYYTAANDSAALGQAAAPAAIALYDSARVNFSRAVAGDSLFVEAWVNLGSVYDDLSSQKASRDRAQQQADQREAEKAYKRAIALRPADDKALCNLGALYIKARRHSDALAQFNAALAANPKSALAHYNLAIMFAESKIYREALREWKAAADADPNGDIGRRSRDNMKIIEQMMAAPVPAALTKPVEGGKAALDQQAPDR